MQKLPRSFGGALLLVLTLLHAPALYADPPSASDASTRSTLAAAIADRLTPLLPAGERLGGVDLECDPPAGATLNEVAPGVAQLQARSFLVVLEHDHRTLACGATVRAERQVLIAVRDIAAGEAVTDADFRPQWIDAFGTAANGMVTLPSSTGLVATSAIHAGQAPSAWQLARPPLIRPGDLVTVTVTNGPVSLRAQLRSNATAALGDTALLINPESGLPVAVTVTGLRTAALEMQ